MEWINKLKPGTPKNWLLFTAGLIWTAVGILLISLALGWILQPAVDSRWIYLLCGFGLAYLIYKFGFSRLAAKNNQRIQNLPVANPCLFAFQEWHSYPLVLLMIGLGITLRKFTPIPKPLHRHWRRIGKFQLDLLPPNPREYQKQAAQVLISQMTRL